MDNHPAMNWDFLLEDPNDKPDTICAYKMFRKSFLKELEEIIEAVSEEDFLTMETMLHCMERIENRREDFILQFKADIFLDPDTQLLAWVGYHHIDYDEDAQTYEEEAKNSPRLRAHWETITWAGILVRESQSGLDNFDEWSTHTPIVYKAVQEYGENQIKQGFLPQDFIDYLRDWSESVFRLSPQLLIRMAWDGIWSRKNRNHFMDIYENVWQDYQADYH